MDLWSAFPAESARSRQLAHTGSPDQLRRAASPDDSREYDIIVHFICKVLLGFSKQMPASITNTFCTSISYMYLSRYSVHCTRTIPSNAECSHTTPQQPSPPTTN